MAGSLTLLGVGNNSSGGITPLDIASGGNLAAWWDMSQTATITATGSVISQVDDLSGNDNHLVVDAAFNGPDTGTATLNGKNVARCDPSNSEGFITTAAIEAATNDNVLFMGVIRYHTGKVGAAAPIAYQGTATTLSGTRSLIRALSDTGPVSMDYATNPDPTVGSDLSIDFASGGIVVLYHNRNNPAGCLLGRLGASGYTYTSMFEPNQALGDDKWLFGVWGASVQAAGIDFAEMCIFKDTLPSQADINLLLEAWDEKWSTITTPIDLTFTPDKIDGLLAWYDLTGEYSTVTVTSSPDIDSVTDASGEASNDISQATDSRKPHTGRTINSRPVGDFYPAGSIVTNLKATGTPSVCSTLSGVSPTDCTMIIVLNADDFTPGANPVTFPMEIGDGGGNEPAISIQMDNTTLTIERRDDSNTISRLDLAGSPLATGTTYAIFSEVDGADFRNSNMYINNVLQSPVVGVNNAANGAVTFTEISIGARTANSRPWDGMIAEAFVYDHKLTAAERTALWEQWIQSRYGI